MTIVTSFLSSNTHKVKCTKIRVNRIDKNPTKVETGFQTANFRIQGVRERGVAGSDTVTRIRSPVVLEVQFRSRAL